MHIHVFFGPRARSDPPWSRPNSEALSLALGFTLGSALAARYVELEPQAAVPLPVCMEGLLDRHAPSPRSGGYGLIKRRMEELQNHLSSSIRRLQDVHDSALEQSRLNLGETSDFQQLLTKSS